MPRRPAPLALARLSILVAVACPLATSGAQTLGGQVVRLGTRVPVGGASVALVDDSARVVTSDTATSDGAFYLDAPRSGGYRLVLYVAGASFVSPEVALDSGKTVERLFSVPDVPESFSATLFARDVSRAAVPVPGSAIPDYPVEMAARGVRGLVSAMFVVSEKGLPDVSSLRILNAADGAFVNSVRAALQNTRFVPAERDDQAVAQVVQYTYDFGLGDDPPRGDIVVRPAAAAVGMAEVPVMSRDKYIVKSNELASAKVADLMLPEALRRLRPAIYGKLDRDPGAVAGVPRRLNGQYVVSEAMITVNGTRVPNLSILAEIAANQVREVRFWRYSEAGPKFGMQYAYALTVELRN